MKAIVLRAIGDSNQFEMKEVPLPEPKAGEVRIKIKAAGFNPVDFKIRKGEFGKVSNVILGSDCSGVIDAVGENALPFKIGDEVYAIAFGKGSNGTYAESLTLPIQFVSKKPTNLSFEEAASIPLVSLTAYRAMVTSCALEKGGPIFIAGAAGGLGSIAVQLARHANKGPIYTVAGSEESIRCMVENLQIDRENIVPYKSLTIEELQKKLLALNDGSLFSTTVDFVGKDMKKLCVALAAYEGHVITTVPEHPDFLLPVWMRGESPFFSKNLSLHCIFVGAEAYTDNKASWKLYQDHLQTITRLLQSNAIHAPLCKVVGSLSKETVQEAHRLLEEGRVKGKLVMKVS